ncbi:serine hydrolase, partial [Escherichia coli]|uniref:serine hydrolase n=5 Tax=Pseudomonadota TaxID=1224 RepID=UPI0028DFC4F4
IGYQVLGYALERIDGQPYPDIVARRLFRPLGMAASAAAVDDALRARLPVSYASAAGGGYVEQPWFEYTSADGSIVS